MQPIIGIVTNELHEEHEILWNTKIAYTPLDIINGVIKAGGLPLLIPITTPEYAKKYAQKIDGLILSGGQDVSPLLYGEEPIPQLKTTLPTRDNFEIAIIKEILKLQKPIFAICRGMQIINVAMGGTLHQDIDSIKKQSLKHLQETNPKYTSHSILTENESIVNKILGKKTTVNSLHHQAIKKLGLDLKITATSNDGFIEAIESTIKEQYILAVQWHPEILLQNNHQESQKLFNDFVNHCK